MNPRIAQLAARPIAELPYLNATPGRTAAEVVLPLLEGELEGLPRGLDGILVTSDLQGRLPDDRLLGLAVPAWLAELARAGRIPALNRLGVVLCGDLFARPGSTRRGGAGDVREVWAAFADTARWVVGTAGNHDEFGATAADLAAFRRGVGVGFLDGNVVERDGITIGGVAGVVGSPDRVWRRPLPAYVAAVHKVLQARPALLVLHDGPDHLVPGYPGRAEVRALFERHPRRGVVCRGHARWPTRLVDLTARWQVLNADSAVVLLRGAAPVA